MVNETLMKFLPFKNKKEEKTKRKEETIARVVKQGALQTSVKAWCSEDHFTSMWIMLNGALINLLAATRQPQ